MRVVEIRKEAELQALEPAWRSLLAESSSNTVFLTWEWITAWWAVYGRAGELRVLTALDGEGTLRGIAPLRAGTVRKYGQAVQTISFLGDGTNDSDYLDFVIASGYEMEVMESFGLYLGGELDREAIVQLYEIPENSPNLASLRALAQAGRRICSELDVPCATIHLPETWDQYLGMLRPRFRTKVRSVLRSLEGRSEIRFGFCETPEQLERLLPILFDLHKKRWNQEGKPGVFGWKQKRDFYFALSALLLKRDWLRFSWVEWNGKVLACQYGFEYENCYSQLQEGYEPASEHLNIGVGLRAWSIREYIRKGVREYDFLGGVGRHKSDWGAATKLSKQVVVAKPTLKNLVVCEGPEWIGRAKELVKKSVPDALLTARAARRHKQQSGKVVPPAEDETIRKLVANCYVHSRLPILARPLRDKYQLTIAGTNGRHRLSWRKRTEATGRILYYHRVNDDGDPFFPAISTRLFEEQMRYLARNYKVVSMSGLLEHLKGKSKETALAITFDDGYQDNYLNAFPILQRLGLPATIFLSTGSMDSRDPLWFEQLAQALKTTPQEYLDIEIDIPRRLGLRTEQERLEGNLQVQGLLRDLPDSERRKWCAEIFERLGAPDCGARREKMLTWEQVRCMKGQGIDFGGHTVSHPFISKLTKEEVLWEVSECKRRIEEELQSGAEYFAYPSGREQDFGQWNKEVILYAGYRAAVTTIWGTNYRSTDQMELRRGGPWDDHTALFASKLDWYQLVND